MSIGHEATIAGRVFIGGVYRASYTTFHRCIFMLGTVFSEYGVGSQFIGGTGNQFIKCQFTGAVGVRRIDCTPELPTRWN